MNEHDASSFEDTMDVLEARREATEARFHELLGELSRHVADLRDATDRSTTIYQQQIQARRGALAEVKDGLAAAGAAGTDTGPEAGAVPGPGGGDIAWPSGGGLGRRWLNRLARWLMRDYLEVLDRRSDSHTARVDALRERCDRLHDLVASFSEGDDAGALVDALSAARSALQSAVSTHEEILRVINAKDAEVLQRAVAGPLRRMELVFDEFGRQQEALLAELVGKRRHLDALIEEATPARRGR